MQNNAIRYTYILSTELSDIFCALFRPMIMNAAIDIMEENIPDLEALNLNDNKLHGIEHLKVLSQKFKNLKILYMGDNRVRVLHNNIMF